MPSLYTVPPYLVSRVAAHLDHADSISLAQTCRQMIGPAYDVLYHSISLSCNGDVAEWYARFQSNTLLAKHVRHVFISREAFSEPRSVHMDGFGIARDSDIDVWALRDIADLLQLLSRARPPRGVDSLLIADAEAFAADCHWDRTLDAIFPHLTSIAVSASGRAFEEILRHMSCLTTVSIQRLAGIQQDSSHQFDIEDLLDACHLTLQKLAVTGDVFIPRGIVSAQAFPLLTTLELRVTEIDVAQLIRACPLLTRLTVAGDGRVLGAIPKNGAFRLSFLKCTPMALCALSGVVTQSLTLIDFPQLARSPLPDFRAALRSARPATLRVIGWSARLTGIRLSAELDSVRTVAFYVDDDTTETLLWFTECLVPKNVERVHITFTRGGIDTDSLMFQGVLECVQTAYADGRGIWLTVDTYCLDTKGTIRTLVSL